MKYEYKRAVINAVAMTFLCAFFVLGLEIYLKPDVEGLSQRLSRLEGYTDGAYQEPSSLYAELYDLGATEVRVYKAKDSREFAIAGFDGEVPDGAGEVYKRRLAELSEEFKENPTELSRIGDGRIITVNNITVLAVCDTENTAENNIYRYFDLDVD